MTALLNASHEQLVAWARLGGMARAAKLTPEQRSQSSSNAGKATFSRMTPEQISVFATKGSRTYWNGLTPQQRSEAVRARVLARSPEVRRRSARKAIDRRWGVIAYAKNREKVDQVYRFLQEYISAKHYAPAQKEIIRAVGEHQSTREALNILERLGWIERHSSAVIVLNSQFQAHALPTQAVGFEAVPCVATSAKRMAFRKCMDCNDAAIEGRTRCQRHLVLARMACARARLKRAYDRARRAAGGRIIPRNPRHE